MMFSPVTVTLVHVERDLYQPQYRTEAQLHHLPSVGHHVSHEVAGAARLLRVVAVVHPCGGTKEGLWPEVFVLDEGDHDRALNRALGERVGEMTPFERRVLWTQLKLLSRVVPEEGSQDVNLRTLEDGVEVYYNEILQNINITSVVPRDDTWYVLSVLSMYEDLAKFAKSNPNAPESLKKFCEFPGFQPGNEDVYCLLVDHFIRDRGYFSALRESYFQHGSGNSNERMVDRYKKLLTAFASVKDRHRLTETAVRQLMTSVSE